MVRLVATLAAVLVRRPRLVPDGSRRHQRWQVCSAARILVALGVRVHVVRPDVPWPRAGRCQLQFPDDIGWIGELALLTAVPKAAGGWAETADRALPVHRIGTALPATAAGDRVPCPVEIRYRTATGYLSRPPSTLHELLALDGVVVEVVLRPAVDLRPVAALAA